MSFTGRKLLQQDFQRIADEFPELAINIESDLVWTFVFRGTPGTLWAGQSYDVKISFSRQHPNTPPIVCFPQSSRRNKTNKMPPFIDSEGVLCTPFLSHNNWLPSVSVVDVLQHLRDVFADNPFVTHDQLSDISAEAIGNILMFLTEPDICRVGQTCKAYLAVTFQDDFWTNMYYNRCPIPCVYLYGCKGVGPLRVSSDGNGDFVWRDARESFVRVYEMAKHAAVTRGLEIGPARDVKLVGGMLHQSQSENFGSATQISERRYLHARFTRCARMTYWFLGPRGLSLHLKQPCIVTKTFQCFMIMLSHFHFSSCGRLVDLIFDTHRAYEQDEICNGTGKRPAAGAHSYGKVRRTDYTASTGSRVGTADLSSNHGIAVPMDLEADEEKMEGARRAAHTHDYPLDHSNKYACGHTALQAIVYAEAVQDATSPYYLWQCGASFDGRRPTDTSDPGQLVYGVNLYDLLEALHEMHLLVCHSYRKLKPFSNTDAEDSYGVWLGGQVMPCSSSAALNLDCNLIRDVLLTTERQTYPHGNSESLRPMDGERQNRGLVYAPLSSSTARAASLLSSSSIDVSGWDAAENDHHSDEATEDEKAPDLAGVIYHIEASIQAELLEQSQGSPHNTINTPVQPSTHSTSPPTASLQWRDVEDRQANGLKELDRNLYITHTPAHLLANLHQLAASINPINPLAVPVQHATGLQHPTSYVNRPFENYSGFSTELALPYATGQVRVHFIGHQHRFDETFASGSAKLCPFRTRTHRPTTTHMDEVKTIIEKFRRVKTRRIAQDGLTIYIRCLWLLSRPGGGMIRYQVSPDTKLRRVCGDFVQLMCFPEGADYRVATINLSEATGAILNARLHGDILEGTEGVTWLDPSLTCKQLELQTDHIVDILYSPRADESLVDWSVGPL